MSTRRPAACTAIECSQCAGSEPSRVLTVQPSSWVTVSMPPEVTMGSMAITRPGRTAGPRPRTR
ncbi:hypothetical protein AEQ27_03625 [Frigoribacterium sp. RIT-PI-h]|nr:hypothetical protein AEQ27_03625 [Frigoribacterium sp. RIT-PI-h]